VLKSLWSLSSLPLYTSHNHVAGLPLSPQRREKAKQTFHMQLWQNLLPFLPARLGPLGQTLYGNSEVASLLCVVRFWVRVIGLEWSIYFKVCMRCPGLFSLTLTSPLPFCFLPPLLWSPAAWQRLRQTENPEKTHPWS
jgi:hypothetical protein